MCSLDAYNVLPNQPGIISNLAMASADVRHADPAVSLLMKEKMQRAAHASAALSGCEAVVDNHWSWGGDLFDHGLINDLRELADQLGYDWRDIQSQAGHDAYFLASCCPTAMIFTPCKDGVSHNPDEYSSKKDLEPGANLLLHAVLKQANR